MRIGQFTRTNAARAAPEHGVQVPRGRVEHRLAAGSAASTTSFAVGAVASVVQVPILLSVWTPEQFGLWMLVLATYGMIVAIDAGHQEYVCRAMVLAGQANVETVRALLGSAVRAAILIGALELAVAVALIATPLWQDGQAALMSDVPERESASVALVALVANFATFGSVGGIVARLYEVHGMLSRSIWLGVATRVVIFLATMGAAVAGQRLLGVAVAHIASSALMTLVLFVDVRRRFPILWPWWRHGSLSRGLKACAQSTLLTLGNICDQASSSALLAVSGTIGAPHTTALWSTTRTIANTASQASSTALLPLAPEMGRYMSQGHPRKLETSIVVAYTLISGTLAIAALAAAPVLPWIYERWTRGTMEFSGELAALLLGAVLVRQWQAPLAICLSCANATGRIFAVQSIRAISVILLAFALASRRDSVVWLAIAVLAGEVAAAALSWRVVYGTLIRYGARLPRRTLLLSLGQVSVACSGLWFGLCGRASWALVLPISLGAIVAMLAAQALALPSEARRRLIEIRRRPVTHGRCDRGP